MAKKDLENQSLLFVKFPEQSQAYEALSELKKRSQGPEHRIVQAAVVEKSINDDMVYKDGFTTEQEHSNDWFKGGMIGAVVGILGGPCGVLLGGGIGSLIGAVVTGDKINDQSKIIDGKLDSIEAENPFIIALIDENDQRSLDQTFYEIDERIVIRRSKAEDVANEIAESEKKA